MPKRHSTKSRTGAAAIKWIEQHCRIPEGDVGAKVKLRDWQKEIIRSIYDNPAGTRRAIISMGRKNAKTGLSAFLLLLHLCSRKFAKVNSELYSSAMSREQAARLFDMAAKIVRLSPTLKPYVIVKDTAKELVCQHFGTKYKALSAEASTAMGLNPAFIVHDELGQVRGPRSALYEALETAVGAQADPLSIIISTQAPTDADLLSVLIDDALGGADPCVKVTLYTAPIDDDPFCEETIRKANPAFGDFLIADKVLAMAADAARMPSKEAEFRNLILNQRVEAKSPFISRDVWAKCGSTPKPFDNRMPVYGGLDLSAVRDITALVLVGRIDGKWHVHPTFWLPAQGLTDKARIDRVPYDDWARQGFIKTAPGASVDYEYVANYLRGLFDAHNIVKLGFDRKFMEFLKPWLIRAGFSEQEFENKFHAFGQGWVSMTPALRFLETEVANQRLCHGNHPVLDMCAHNAVVKGQDHARILTKPTATARIDGMVALTMAMGVAPMETRTPDYQIHFI